MESFLKNRPVHGDSPVQAARPAGPEVGAQAVTGPFAPIQRPAAPAEEQRASSGSKVEAEAAEVDAGCSADGASVRAIVEHGRVTRLVITCSCGKVTEVACEY